MLRSKIGLLLKIRFMQAFRALKSVGLPLLLVVAPLLFFFSLSILAFLESLDLFYLILLELLIVGSIHFRRSDYWFLRKTGVSPSTIYFFEYNAFLFILNLIFSISLKRPWLMVAGVPAAIMLAPLQPILVNITSKTTTPFLVNWIPEAAFEWRAGMRQYGLGIVLLYLLCLAMSHFLAFPLLGIILLLFFIGGFYEEIEARPLIEHFFLGKAGFQSKLSLHLGLVGLFFLPLLVLLFIRHTESWAVLVATCLAIVLFISFILSYKYAHYLPTRRVALLQNVSGFFFFFLIIPFTTPIAFIALIYYIRKAKKRMRYFYPPI